MAGTHKRLSSVSPLMLMGVNSFNGKAS